MLIDWTLLDQVNVNVVAGLHLMTFILNSPFNDVYDRITDTIYGVKV